MREDAPPDRTFADMVGAEENRCADAPSTPRPDKPAGQERADRCADAPLSSGTGKPAGHETPDRCADAALLPGTGKPAGQEGPDRCADAALSPGTGKPGDQARPEHSVSAFYESLIPPVVAEGRRDPAQATGQTAAKDDSPGQPMVDNPVAADLTATAELPAAGLPAPVLADAAAASRQPEAATSPALPVAPAQLPGGAAAEPDAQTGAANKSDAKGPGAQIAVPSAKAEATEAAPAPAAKPSQPASQTAEGRTAPAQDTGKAAGPADRNALPDRGAQPIHSGPGAEHIVITPAHAAGPAAAASHAAPVSAAQPIPVQAIAVEIAAQAQAGNARFEIRLDPPELGRIDVRLDVDRDGNVSSRLVIERADTYDLLRRDQSTLERALQQAGLKTSGESLEFTLRDQGLAQRQHHEGHRPAVATLVEERSVLSSEATNGYTRPLARAGGIDIHV